VSTVPAPTTKSSICDARAMASAAASVRKVISATETSACKRAARGLGRLGIRRAQDRDDAVALEPLRHLAHRASQPPSTGRTTPCT